MQKFGWPVFAVVAFLTVGVLAGCDLSRNSLRTDRSVDLDFQDYRDALAPRPMESASQKDKDGAGIPSFQDYVSEPSENQKSMPLVSISINQTTPLRDALFEMAERTGYDIELDPRITGSIIFTARERPLDLVVQRIAEIAGLRYKFENDILRIELDTPYQENYKIDYLSFVRKNKGSIRNDVAVVSGGGTNTGSQFEAASESEANFWAELEGNLKQILGVEASTGNLKTSSDPQITAAEPNPAPVEAAGVANKENADDDHPAASDSAEAPPVQAPQAVLQVNSLPTNDLSGGSAQSANQQQGSKISFSLNKQAGMITVFATERQHDEIKKYLTELRRSITSQVLIEAKVLEVELSDEYSTGIDWSVIRPFSGDLAVGFDVTAASLNADLEPAVSPASNFTASYLNTGNLQGAIQAISRFGTVRGLASPRLTVLNNQSAVLNVADNQVYFEIDITTTAATDTTAAEQTIDSEIKNVPEGVLINVQPSIDLQNRTISMSVRPTVTKIIDFVEDPAIQFVTADAGITGVQSRVPIVNVQELDSVIKLSDGQAVVMGGLLQDRANTTENGVPILAEIPLFGAAFKNHADKITKTELVIFLKATIVDGGETIDDADRDLYKTFAHDRRPLKL